MHLVPQEEIDRLAYCYGDFDRAFTRTKSRAAIDGGLLLLAILDELRSIREKLELQKESKRR